MGERSEEKSSEGGGVISRIFSDPVVDAGGGGGGGKESEVENTMVSGNRGEKELEEVTHGGFIDNIVTAGHLLHQNETSTVPPPPPEKTLNGAGILDGIVSHLPAAITNGLSPETEEASMLIQSIVRE